MVGTNHSVCLVFFVVSSSVIAWEMDNDCASEDTQSLLQVVKISQHGTDEGADEREDTYPPLQNPGEFDKDFVHREPSKAEPAKLDKAIDAIDTAKLKGIMKVDKNDEEYVQDDFTLGMTDNVGLQLMVQNVSANATNGLEDVRLKVNASAAADTKFLEARQKHFLAQNATIYAKNALSAQIVEVDKSKAKVDLYQHMADYVKKAKRELSRRLAALHKGRPKTSVQTLETDVASVSEDLDGEYEDIVRTISDLKEARTAQIEVSENLSSFFHAIMNASDDAKTRKRVQARMEKLARKYNESENYMEIATTALAIAKQQLVETKDNSSRNITRDMKAYAEDVKRLAQAKAQKEASKVALSYLNNMSNAVGFIAVGLKSSRKEYKEKSARKDKLGKVLVEKRELERAAWKTLRAAQHSSDAARAQVVESAEHGFNTMVQAMYDLKKGINLRSPFDKYALIKGSFAHSLLVHPLCLACLIFNSVFG